MRRVLLVAIVLCMLTPARLPGGVYNFAEPPDGFGTFEEFRDSLKRLRQIYSVEIQTPHRQRYRLLADLAEKGVQPTLDDLERLNLSGYLLYVRKSDPRQNERLSQLAVEILQPVVRRDPSNFLAWSNLATAYHRLGQNHRALDALGESLARWPKSWRDLPKERQKWLSDLGWNEAQFQWYREVETYQRKLLLLRLREGTMKSPQTVDALFDKEDSTVRFVGPSGKYEAGKLALSEKVKLPKNALAIVEQLVLWMPDDLRLIWLAGELFNAEGNARGALTLFNELVEANQYAPPELEEHRRTLRREAPAEQRPPLDFSEPGAKNETKSDVTSPWPTNPWQLLGVGFGAGAVIALLGAWQVREIRRRLRAPARS
jgi:tetratricopeptide (TPR) repeat protein